MKMQRKARQAIVKELHTSCSPFVAAYGAIKTRVAAIVRVFYPEGRPDFPEIFGSGFVVSELGLVCTCKHVADAIRSMPVPPGYSGFPAAAMLFLDLEIEGQRSVAVITIPILQIGDATILGDTKNYLGPNPPDVSFLLLAVKDIPAVRLASEPLQEGEEIGFAGFPMGTRTLLAPGWLHQLSPTLHRGAIGAVLPHQSDVMPHGFLVHANTQGGASGSPVFRDDSTVVGMVYMVLQDRWMVGGGLGDRGSLLYPVPTSLTGCVPFGVIAEVLKHAEAAVPSGPREPLQEYIKTREPTPLSDRNGAFQVWPQGHSG